MFRSIAIAALIVTSLSANAAIVGVRYSGFVNYLDNPDAGFPIPVALGDPLEITFAFDSATVDSLPDDALNGRYENTVIGWSARIGEQSFDFVADLYDPDGNSRNAINVVMNGHYGVQRLDMYDVEASALMPSGVFVTSWTSLRNDAFDPDTPFDTDALFPGALPTDVWLYRDFGLSFWDPQAGGRTIFGTPTASAVVPAPPAAWLLGTALAGLGGRRWLRRRAGA